MNLTQSFLQELEQLNDKQKLAVETLEGPVMVIAGPGTGKTQILAARIGAILSSAETQAAPHNILCLTYTDAGAVAMRKRLLKFIGPDAYRVNIFTFHGFCNQVIQENMDLFGIRELEPISELEQIQLLRDILDALPAGNILKRYGGDLYNDLPRLKTLFSHMKKEKLTAAYISQKIDEHLKELPFKDEYIYKRATKNAKVGDVKQDKIDAEKQTLDRTRAAAQLFDSYQDLMRQRGRYDFDDMITWVSEAFDKNEGLLRRYQEQFLYMLVDEFQDTSGTQNYLLQQLSSFWDIPNIFVVGDDDQSIYSFQGANLRNILDFINRYGNNVSSVILDKNYRSSQLILDTARELISRNVNRISPDKYLAASNPQYANLEYQPEVRAYHNEVHETAGIAMDIIKLRDEGVSLSEIAVLYSKHRQAEDLARYLQYLGVPVNIKRRVNVLQEPLVMRLTRLLQFISNESRKPFSAEDLLFGIMHDPCFEIDSMEIARFALEMRDYKLNRKWRDELYKRGKSNGQASLFEASADPLKRFSSLIEGWIRDLNTHTLQQFLEKILTESGIIRMAASSEDRLWQMELLHSFFDFVKEETARKPTLRLDELMETIDLMNEHQIAIPLQKVSYSAEGINFITAHSSKGLEFDYVFVTGCLKDYWDSTRNGNGFKFPETIVPFVGTDESEERRRLFYVALTRARKKLIVSYPQRNSAKEKGLEKSRFVAEIDELAWVKKTDVILPDAEIEKYLSCMLTTENKPDITLIEKQYLDKLLENYSLSVTHLSAYLRCPVSFYFNNLLRIPAAKSPAMTFGSAVHKALERYFKKMQESENKAFPATEVLLNEFEWQMKKHRDAFTEKDYTLKLEYGSQILPKYHSHYSSGWNNVSVLEYRIADAQAFGVPMNGILDKLEFNGKQVNVVDYKTGRFDKTKLSPPNPDADPETADFTKVYGGDYWRQAAFYKVLMDNDPLHKDWEMVSAEFDFVEPDRKSGEFSKERINITPIDVELLKSQVEYAWNGIMNHEFSKGCGKEDCQWCQFAKMNAQMKQSQNISEVVSA